MISLGLFLPIFVFFKYVNKQNALIPEMVKVPLPNVSMEGFNYFSFLYSVMYGKRKEIYDGFIIGNTSAQSNAEVWTKNPYVTPRGSPIALYELVLKAGVRMFE